MIFKQYYLGCLAHASYLIGDEETRIAVIVDPQRDIDQYLQDAKENNFDIRYVFLTHFHADFVSGHLELRKATGAEIHMGANAHPDFPHHPMKDGYEIEFGTVLLKILETPGHTPESISILVFDVKQSKDNPYAVLTGDTLFIGDVGRPDLLASSGITAEDLAGRLYDSLHKKLLPLPDDTLVYPAHGAGSLCGKNISTQTLSTMGEQRKDNDALQPMSKDEFIRKITRDQPEAPKYFAYDAAFNQRDHELLDETLGQELHPLCLDDVLTWKSNGAYILDVRNPADFANGHLNGSLNIGLEGKFATWVGILLDSGVPIIIIAEPGREQEASMRGRRIGFDNMAGYLKEGIAALRSTPELIQETPRITATELAEKLMTAEWPLILDVRTEHEWAEGRIDSSRNIPLPHLIDHLGEIPRDRPVVVHCAGGYRSSLAASLLEHHGFTNIMDLVGGFDAWEQEVVHPNLYSPESLQQSGG
jgi:glyoxylase-like metal-dependent hydrolase (beta-lactamase superfamily II)